jgi:hypothetical protein
MHALTRKERLLAAIGLSVFAAIVPLAFEAYCDPTLLIDFANNIRLLCS